MTASGVVNIAAALVRMAHDQPNAAALLIPQRQGYRTVTFRELDELSDRIARGLASVGIARGTRTVLMVKPSLEFFAITFALFRAGAVPVLVDPGMGIGNLGQCLDQAQPEAFVGIPQAHAAARVMGWARSTLKHRVCVGWPMPGAGTTLASLIRRTAPQPAEPAAETTADEIAAILFTSGSTGVPKGAVYTHGIFDTQVQMLRDALGIVPGEIDLCTFPLFALFAPALGMTAVIPVMDFTRPGRVHPPNIIEPIHKLGVTNMFGSPALIDRVGRYAQQRQVSLPTLKRVICAGAPVPARVIERFCRLLTPPAQLFTPYGATESLPVAIMGSDQILHDTRELTAQGRGICVGQPLPGLDVRVIRISDEPIPRWNDSLQLPPGEIGEIAVRGPMVTQGYYNRPDLTALAKIADPESGSLFHRMGDVGYFDDQGRLWFCGRKAHRVVTGQGTLFTICCEAIYNTHPKVYRSALVGARVDGQVIPTICIELEKDVPASVWPTIQQELRQLGQGHALTRSIGHLLLHRQFPVDVRHNAKIFREKLAQWATGQLRAGA